MQIKEYPRITTIASNDLLLVQTDEDDAYKSIEASDIQGVNSSPFIQLLDRKTSGVDGGTAINSVWSTRRLNTIEHDDTGLVTLADNIFSLPAGTYEIDAFSEFYLTNQTKIRLLDVTTNTPIIYGANSYFASPDRGGNNYGYTVIKGRFSLLSSSGITLQYYCANPYSSTANLGGASISDGSPEIYTSLIMKKVG